MAKKTNKRSHFTSHRVESLDFDKKARAVSVRFDDGDLAYATLDALKVPRRALAKIVADEFRRGIEFHFEDGSMHDVSVDYFAWLAAQGDEQLLPEADAIAETIAENVIRLREERSLSQSALADLAQMRPPNVSRLESGDHVPTLEVLLRVAGALKVSLPMLLGVLPGIVAAAPKERRASSRKIGGR